MPYVANYLIPNSTSNMSFMISEFQPVQGSGAGTGNQHPNLPSTTLYGGIYASEFVMRMSTIPRMKFVGNFQIFNENGINATNVFRQAVVNAADGGYVTNTAVLTNQFLETFVTGSDPAATNTSPEASPIRILTQNASNPVTIPQYSVVRLEWAAFNVPQPSLSLSGTENTKTLTWAGLTNVTYSVQGAGRLTEPWTTLGRVSNTQSNFSFTNWNTGALQFYLLAVP